MTSYRLLINTFIPLIVIYTAKIALRCGSFRYFLQRFGFKRPVIEPGSVWIHCASVGEVNTALPLVKLLIEQSPGKKILLTTVTPTGAEIVARQKLDNIVHCYLPVDLTFCVKRFLKRVKPGLALILETELWPELYFQCARQSIPIAIINGRLSKRTLNANQWMRKQYQSALDRVSHVLARSESDRDGFMQLGCDENRLEVLGNLKFASARQIQIEKIENFTDRHYLLLASSHHDEEIQFARIWQQIDKKDYLLVIVPRHPERGSDIVRDIEKLGYAVAQRSRGDSITDETEVYVADTLGELVNIMASADVVFMGGSLIEHGGQNILEPACLAKPIIIGPHFYNFQQEVDIFLQHQACIQLQDINQLAEVISQLLVDEQLQKQLSSSAQQLMLVHEGVAEKYRDKILDYYKNYF